MWDGSTSEGGNVKRLFRYLFTLCSAVSLLLCVTVCALWGRSYGVSDDLAWIVQHETQQERSRRQTRFGIGMVDGEIHVGRGSRTWNPEFGTFDLEPAFSWSTRANESRFTVPGASFWRRLGFSYQRTRSFSSILSYSFNSDDVVLPFWAIAVATALLPACFVAARRTARRHCRLSLCPICGYDIRASPERCPECGTATKAAT
jgi:hypothetical protein